RLRQPGRKRRRRRGGRGGGKSLCRVRRVLERNLLTQPSITSHSHHITSHHKENNDADDHYAFTCPASDRSARGRPDLQLAAPALRRSVLAGRVSPRPFGRILEKTYG